jgi:hypothetical protein
MTTTIIMEFLRVLNAFTGAQDKNILPFVDNCAVHLQDTLFLQNVKFVYYPPNAQT